MRLFRFIPSLILTVLAVSSCLFSNHNKGVKEDEEEIIVKYEDLIKGAVPLSHLEVTNYGDFYNCKADNFVILMYEGEPDMKGDYHNKPAEVVTIDLIASQPGCKTLPVGTYRAAKDLQTKHSFICTLPYTLGEYLDYLESEGWDAERDKYKGMDLDQIWGYDYSSYYWQLDTNNRYYGMVEGGLFIVYENDEGYTVLADFTVDGEESKFVYKGEIKIKDATGRGFTEPLPTGDNSGIGPGKDTGADTPNFGNVDYGAIPHTVITDDANKAEAAFWNDYYENGCGDWDIIVYSEDPCEQIGLEILTASMDATKIEPGKYVVKDTNYGYNGKPGDALAFYEYSYGDYADYGGCYYGYGLYYWYKSTEGEVIIEDAGNGKYTITWRIVDGDERYGGNYCGTYTGPVDITDYTDKLKELLSETKAGTDRKSAKSSIIRRYKVCK